MQVMRRRRPLFVLLAVVLVGCLAPGMALAAQFMSDDAEALVESGTTVEGNLYATGQTVTIEGTVDGDLICAGGQVALAKGGVVTGDLMCAGQSVEISGEVRGDVRSAGYLVRVNEGGIVGGELMGAGFAVEVEPGATIGDDVMAAGSQVRLAGTVGGNARVGAAGLAIDGAIEGDVDASVGGVGEGMPANAMPWNNQVPRMPAAIGGGLHLGEEASIGGNLSYSSPAAFDVPRQAVAGDVDHELVTTAEASGPAVPEQPWPLRWLLAALRRAFALFVLGALLLWLAPRLAEAGRGLLFSQALPGLGWGCGSLFGAGVLLIGLGIATILALILFSALTLGEFSSLALAVSAVLGTLLSFGVYLLAWMGQSVVATGIGRLILRDGDPASRGRQLAVLALGAILLAAVITVPVPVLGSLLRLTAAALGLGTMLLALMKAFREPNAETIAVAPLAAD